jgi:NADH-quinone oxidoreductase subunit K
MGRLARSQPVPSTASYLMLSATLFAVGLVGVIVRRNMITVLMCIELMLNAVNINLIAFSHHLASLEGQVFTIFVITVAAGEAAVGLAIIIQVYRLRSTVNIDERNVLNG